MIETKSIRGRQATAESGFTLVELMVVMAVILLLLTIAIPSYMKSVLKEDLHTMRTAIDQYTVDKEKAPQGLDDLVQAGYMKSIPMDPMTSRTDTWMVSESDTMTNISETQGGIDDVKSGAQALGMDGTSYNTW